MKYKFGVMSSRWEMEACDIKVAKLAMMMFIGKEIPIAIYEPKVNSFMPSVDFIKENVNYKRHEVHLAMDSIKRFVKLNKVVQK